MNAFVVELANTPGMLADVSEAVAAAGVNITAVVAATCGDKGHVIFTADDESAARSALGSGGWTYSETEITTIDMAHRPGSLATVARKLAADGINVEAVMPMGMAGEAVTVGFVTDDPTTAGVLLAEVGAAS